MGGMAAFVPNRRDPGVTTRALSRVRQDKQRESADGFDGTWVAHPDLVAVAMEVFDDALGDNPNQLSVLRDDVAVTGFAEARRLFKQVALDDVFTDFLTIPAYESID